MDLKSLMASVYDVQFTVGSELLQQAMQQESEERAKAALKFVREILTKGSSNLQLHVQALRSLRKQEKELAAKVKRLDRAFQFFVQEGNPLPYFKASGDIAGARQFCRSTGIDIPDDKNEAWEVPADFKTPVKTKA